MQKDKLVSIVKVLLFSVGSLFYLFFGLIFVVFSTLIIGNHIHLMTLMTLVTILMIVFWLFVFKLLFIKTMPRIINYGFLVVIGLIGLSIVGLNLHNNHIQSIRLEERGINLYDYKPFEDKPLLARLDDDASLSLTGDLPRLDGATALYPVYAAFTEAVYPEGEYDPYHFYAGESQVVSTQTGTAYDRLINGETDIIFVAGPSEKQRQDAEDKGVTLNLTPIGKEAFVFFVHKDNPVNSLTVEEIKQIYSGNITNWKTVGGNDEVIRAFQRPAGSGSQTALINLMQGTELMDPLKEDVVGGMGGIITQTASYRNHKNAIGFSFRNFSMDLVENNDIKHLALNNVFPTIETITDGTYPVSDYFYAVTVDNLNPSIEPFIAWILSEEGQTLIKRSGYVPIN